jgi:chromosome segregation ATPase
MGLFKEKKSEEQMDATERNMERGLDEAEQQEYEEQSQMSNKPSEGEKFLQMSMPELWKMASSLGISKKGHKEELIEGILDAQKSGEKIIHNNTDVNKTLEQLKTILGEYERIREGIKTKIESISESIPKLDEKKEFLEKDIDQMQERITEVTELFPKLEDENESLQKDIQEKLEKKKLLEKEIVEKREKIKEIANLLPKLERNKEDAKKSMQHNREEILKIDVQIKQIQNFQKDGLDSLSTSAS